MTGCTDCERLTTAYENATAARMQAEAELTAATFSHDPKVIMPARRKVMAAIVRWHHASGELRQHKHTHGMAAAKCFDNH